MEKASWLMACPQVPLGLVRLRVLCTWFNSLSWTVAVQFCPTAKLGLPIGLKILRKRRRVIQKNLEC